MARKTSSASGTRKIQDLMTRDVATCDLMTPLSEVARVMWDRDCGFVPIVDPETRELQGVVTDRDICMAAYTTGRPIADIAAVTAMSSKVFSCKPDEDVTSAHEAMRSWRVRRVPVVDAESKVVGIVSLNDVALDALEQKGAALEHVARTLGEICRHRSGGETEELPPAEARAPQSATRSTATKKGTRRGTERGASAE